MENVNQKIANFRAEGDKMFANLGGRRDEYLGADRFSNMAGLIQNDVPQQIIIDITNTGAADLAAPLFSANEAYPVPYNSVLDEVTGNTPGAGVGIVITPQDYSANELKKMTETSPFAIVGLRYDFGDNTQLKKKFVMRRKEGSTVIETPYYPQIKQRLENNISTVLEDDKFLFLADAKATLFVIVGAGKTIQLVLTTGPMFNAANALKGQSVIEVGKKTY